MNQNQKTYVCTVRTSAENFALLARFFQQKNVQFKTRSELASLSLNHLAELVLVKNPELAFSSLTAALEFLANAGLSCSQNKKLVFKALQRESIRNLGTEFAEGFSKQVAKAEELEEATKLLKQIMEKKHD